MVVRTFIIGEGAVVDGENGTKPLVVGSRLYKCKGDYGDNEYTGIVTTIEKAGKANFGLLCGITCFIPHDSSPVDSRLTVWPVHDDAWKVTADFIDPNEQIISIESVNVRLFKGHEFLGQTI
jgi:hypothetical protein